MANKKQKMKYTTEELNAMRINAMLQGIDPSTITNEVLEDDIEIEIEDDEPKAKKTRRTKKEDKPVVKQHLIEVLPCFSGLVKSTKIKVAFNQHDIPYKEQLWNIDHRTVDYLIELVTIPKLARDCSEIFNPNNTEAGAKAYNGEVRYYKVITYDTVPYVAKEIGCVKVWEQDGKLKTSIYVNKKVLKEVHANADKVLKSIKEGLHEVIK